MSRLPVPEGTADFAAVAPTALALQSSHEELVSLTKATLHRLADIAPAIPTIAAFRRWPDLDFAALRALIARLCRTDIAPGERDAWEGWFAIRRADAAALRARIADAEAAINDRCYHLFGLDRDEVAAIEEALAGQY